MPPTSTTTAAALAAPPTVGTNSAGFALLRRAIPALALAAPCDDLITAVCPLKVTGASR
ncbi:hypothetical protein [Lentzea sp. NPDC059081]|uniref:hypothetical protein n=1 Tax=Lentzea sp. NPDC059081 TaxID=3346719 RepID=UPI00368BBA4F